MLSKIVQIESDL